MAASTATRTVEQLMAGAKLDPEPFINIPETLSLIPGMTKNHLAQLRFDHEGPKFYKPTGRTVFYKASEVLDWIANNGVKNGTEVSA